jgi:hypothetical protein
MLPGEKNGIKRPPLHVSPVLFSTPTMGYTSSSTSSTPSTNQTSRTPSKSPPRIIIDSPVGTPISCLGMYPRELMVEVYTDYLEENKKVKKPYFLSEIKHSADNMLSRKNYIEILDGLESELSKKRLPCSLTKTFKNKEKSSELWMLLDPPKGVECEEEALERRRSRRNSEDVRSWKNSPDLDDAPEIEKKNTGYLHY